MTSSGENWENRIPDRMRRRDRAPNPIFHPDENIYLRVSAEKWANASHIELGFLFRVGGQSVNRSWPDGKWEDVLLWEYPTNLTCGVLTFRFQNLPQAHNRGAGIDPVEFRLEHKPEDLNFYHSEISAFKGNAPEGPLKKVPGSSKTYFRLHMSRVLSKDNILKEPEFK